MSSSFFCLASQALPLRTSSSAFCWARASAAFLQPGRPRSMRTAESRNVALTSLEFTYYSLYHCWLVVWNIMYFPVFSHILGMSSSQLMNSYFSEVLKPQPPTRRKILMNTQQLQTTRWCPIVRVQLVYNYNN